MIACCDAPFGVLFAVELFIIHSLFFFLFEPELFLERGVTPKRKV